MLISWLNLIEITIKIKIIEYVDDITDEDTPLEAGLDFVVKFDKAGGFIGRDALLQQQEAGVARRLLQFKLEDPEPLLYHNEPIWRDGEICGHITSGAYGHSLAGCIGLGYVEVEPGAKPEAALARSQSSFCPEPP